MIKTYFQLKDPKALKTTSIRLRASVNGERLIFGTGKVIHPELWDSETERPVKNTKLINKHSKDQPQLDTHLINLKNYLNKLEKDFENIINNLEKKEIQLSKDVVLEELGKVYNKESNTAKEKKITLNDYIEQYINEIKSGERLTEKLERYKYNTIKSYNGFQSQFNEYQKVKRKKIDFEDVTMDFYDKFISFFNSKNYSPNTIGKHIKNLKTVVRAAREEKLNQNFEIDRKKFKTIKVATDEIYLNEKEIERLFSLDLSDCKEHDLARDLFLVGCYLAQRYSDFSRILPHYLQETSQGGKVINLTQLKTGIKVSIPVKYELDVILSKYNYHLPKSHEQKLNKYIKEVGKRAGLDDLVEVELIRGGLKIKKTVPKYELIKTHTARRSGATNMYLAGIPTLEIMKITGHTTEANLLKYIKATTEETAIKLANHSYFNPSKLQVV